MDVKKLLCPEDGIKRVALPLYKIVDSAQFNTLFQLHLCKNFFSLLLVIITNIYNTETNQ